MRVVKRLAGPMVVTLLTLPAISVAGTISPETLAELMAEAASADGTAIGVLAGADPHSPLSFTSFVAPGGTSYTYSSVAGSMYAGLPFSLTSTGVFDPVTDTLTVLSTVNVAGIVQAIKGILKLLGQTDNYDMDMFDKNMKKTGDVHVASMIVDEDKIKDEKFRTDKDGKQKGGKQTSELNFTGLGNPGAGNYVYAESENDLGWDVGIVGFSPLDGGDGNFTMTLMPEPSSLAVLGLGALGLMGIRRSRKPEEPRRGTPTL